MHFCNECNNMYYIRVSGDDGKKLIYYCRNCGHEDDLVSSENICVSKTNFKRSEQKYNHIVNEYTKLDPTLPRTKNIKCPNEKCNEDGETKSTENNEIIYLRYDNDNMKYIYLCSNCNYSWKNN